MANIIDDDSVKNIFLESYLDKKATVKESLTVLFVYKIFFEKFKELTEEERKIVDRAIEIMESKEKEHQERKHNGEKLRPYIFKLSELKKE